MHVAAIKYADIANGPGVRTSLFVSGCRHKCPFCFNRVAWDFEYGSPFGPDTEQEVLDSLAPDYIRGLTVLGGEPMEPENQRGLVDFLERVRAAYPQKSLWLYTGDVYESLISGGSRTTEVTERILACVDVLVDGPFVQKLHDVSLRFRGSSNQRLIDMPKTRAAGHVVLWEDEPLYAAHAQRAAERLQR